MKDTVDPPLVNLVRVYVGLPALRMLPGGLAVLVWAGLRTWAPGWAGRWVWAGLLLIGAGGGVLADRIYRSRFGRVRRLGPKDSLRVLGMLAAPFALVWVVGWAEAAVRQGAAISIDPFLLAMVAFACFWTTGRLAWHYVGIAAGFVIFGILPLWTHMTARWLVVEPGTAFLAVVGSAMVVAAVLDHRLLMTLFRERAVAAHG